MSAAGVDAVTRLMHTFDAYIAANRASDRVHRDYQFLRASEAAVHRAQQVAAQAREAHIDAIKAVNASDSVTR